jgi:hypothetical protein
MYQRSWHQISLADLSGEEADTRSSADPELYASFYRQLAQGCGSISEQWVRDKITLGRAIASEVFQVWKRRYGRRPRVLALAVGQGVAEAVWLEQGYDVTLHECQSASMGDLCTRFPDAPTVFADLRDIVIPAKFDIIVMIASEYVFTREELTRLLRVIEGGLDRNGWMVLHSVSILSMVRLAKENLKRLRGSYTSPEHVSWGWWRTPAEIAKCASAAGMKAAAAYRAVQISGGGTTLRPRSPWQRVAMTWSDEAMLIVLERHRGHFTGNWGLPL